MAAAPVSTLVDEMVASLTRRKASSEVVGRTSAARAAASESAVSTSTFGGRMRTPLSLASAAKKNVFFARLTRSGRKRPVVPIAATSTAPTARSTVERDFRSTTSELRVGGGSTTADGFVRATGDGLDMLHQSPGQLTGVTTGFTELDRMTTGLQPGHLIVIAGHRADVERFTDRD